MPLSTPEKDKMIAATLTFVCVLAILLLLFFGSISTQKQQLAQYSTPEFVSQSPEFYEPELLSPPQAPSQSQPEAVSPTDGNDLTLPANEPAPQIPPVARREPESNIITDVPPDFSDYGGPSDNSLTSGPPAAQSNPHDSALSSFLKAADAVAGSFSKVDNHPNRKPAGVGHDPFTQGIVGTVPGRIMLSCPKPYIHNITRPVIVTVEVTVDAEGSVIRALASGDADASIRRKCEEAARRSQWNAAKNTQNVKGTIIFTLQPSQD